VLGTIGGEVLRPAVADAVVAGVLKALQPTAPRRNADRHRREIASLDAEIARLADAIAAGERWPAY
jgi:hypothetical protein